MRDSLHFFNNNMVFKSVEVTLKCTKSPCRFYIKTEKMLSVQSGWEDFLAKEDNFSQ